MKSFISAAVLALFASAASAVSIPKEARSDDSASTANVLTKRAITHLFICSDTNFTGRCQNLESNTEQCYNLGNGFNDVISSLGPDSGTTCTIWEDINCSGASVPGIVSPGIFDLNDFGFNDRASSYRCE